MSNLSLHVAPMCGDQTVISGEGTVAVTLRDGDGDVVMSLSSQRNTLGLIKLADEI